MSAQIPIIGMGGIQNAADVIEFMVAGAIAVAWARRIFTNRRRRYRSSPAFANSWSGKNQRRPRDHRQRPDGEVRFTARTATDLARKPAVNAISWLWF
jgi:hypothetical protein